MQPRFKDERMNGFGGEVENCHDSHPTAAHQCQLDPGQIAMLNRFADSTIERRQTVNGCRGE